MSVLHQHCLLGQSNGNAGKLDSDLLSYVSHHIPLERARVSIALSSSERNDGQLFPVIIHPLFKRTGAGNDPSPGFLGIKLFGVLERNQSSISLRYIAAFINPELPWFKRFFKNFTFAF